MPKRNRSNRAATIKASTNRASAAAASRAEQPAPAEERTTKRAPGAWRRLYVAAPVALALLTSINTLRNDFAIDDSQMVLNNALVRSIANIPRAFVVSGWAYSSSDIRFAQDTFYRPLLNVILTIEYALFGPTPWGWHLTNVLLHSLVTLLVFLVFDELTGRKWLALIAATLFAVHPVHAESVAWVSGVTDPMMSVFALGAFYCYVRYRRSRNIYLIAGSWALFLGALMCKETALALPVMIEYCELGLFNESSRVKSRSVSAAKMAAPFLVVYAFYFLLRYVALGTPTMGGEALNPPEYVIRTIPLLIVKYLKLLLVPSGYSFQHYTSLTDSMSTL